MIAWIRAREVMLYKEGEYETIVIFSSLYFSEAGFTGMWSELATTLEEFLFSKKYVNILQVISIADT